MWDRLRLLPMNLFFEKKGPLFCVVNKLSHITAQTLNQLSIVAPLWGIRVPKSFLLITLMGDLHWFLQRSCKFQLFQNSVTLYCSFLNSIILFCTFLNYFLCKTLKGALRVKVVPTTMWQLSKKDVDYSDHFVQL